MERPSFLLTIRAGDWLIFKKHGTGKDICEAKFNNNSEKFLCYSSKNKEILDILRKAQSFDRLFKIKPPLLGLSGGFLDYKIFKRTGYVFYKARIVKYNEYHLLSNIIKIIKFTTFFGLECDYQEYSKILNTININIYKKRVNTLKHDVQTIAEIFKDIPPFHRRILNIEKKLKHTNVFKNSAIMVKILEEIYKN